MTLRTEPAPTLTELASRTLAPLLRQRPTPARQSWLSRAIDGLPLRDRVIFALYYEHGLTMAELAEVLDVSAAEVLAMARQAVEDLRAALLALLEQPTV